MIEIYKELVVNLKKSMETLGKNRPHKDQYEDFEIFENNFIDYTEDEIELKASELQDYLDFIQDDVDAAELAIAERHEAETRDHNGWYLQSAL